MNSFEDLEIWNICSTIQFETTKLIIEFPDYKEYKNRSLIKQIT